MNETCACGCSLEGRDSVQRLIRLEGSPEGSGQLVLECIDCARKRLGAEPDPDTVFLARLGIVHPRAHGVVKD